MESDGICARRVKDAGGPGAGLEILGAEGFQVTPAEMRDAVIDRYSGQLTDEMLDALAAGKGDELGRTFDIGGAAAAATLAAGAVVAS